MGFCGWFRLLCLQFVGLDLFVLFCLDLGFRVAFYLFACDCEFVCFLYAFVLFDCGNVWLWICLWVVRFVCLLLELLIWVG